MGLGPAPKRGKGTGEVCDDKSRLSHMGWNLRFLHHQHELSFRTDFFFSSPPTSYSLVALVNNMRILLQKWAQEVSIKRLINV